MTLTLTQPTRIQPPEPSDSRPSSQRIITDDELSALVVTPIALAQEPTPRKLRRKPVPKLPLRSLALDELRPNSPPPAEEDPIVYVTALGPPPEHRRRQKGKVVTPRDAAASASARRRSSVDSRATPLRHSDVRLRSNVQLLVADGTRPRRRGAQYEP